MQPGQVISSTAFISGGDRKGRLLLCVWLWTGLDWDRNEGAWRAEPLQPASTLSDVTQAEPIQIQMVLAVPICSPDSPTNLYYIAHIMWLGLGRGR